MSLVDKKIFHEDRETSLKRVKTIEGLFRLYKVIGAEETIEDLLEKPFPEVEAAFKEVLRSQKEFLNHGEDRNEGSFFLLLVLINLSGTLFFISNESLNQFVKTNAIKIRDVINEMVIAEANPYIIAFFKWDLDRRKWKHEADKLRFLRNTLKSLEEELTGQRDNLIKKYVTLLLRYILHNLDKFIFNTPKNIFEQYGVNREKTYDTRNKLEALTENGQIDEAIDEEMEQTLLSSYMPIVNMIEEGLSVSRGRYDYLIAAFIDAQRDYKNIVHGMVNSLTDQNINDLKSSLMSGNIEKFISTIHSIFASVPHQLLKNTSEAYYHINLHVMLKAIGCDIISEVSTNKGRIDSLIEFTDSIYIVEYKLDGSESAIEQIEANRYYESYLSTGKKILLLGLSFDTVSKNIRKNYIIREAPFN